MLLKTKLASASVFVTGVACRAGLGRFAFVFLVAALLVSGIQAEEFDSDDLPKGHDYYELRDGLNNCRIRFENEKVGRVAFLGGSITAMNGWRQMVIEDLQVRFPDTKFEFVSAGIPSLGSVPHAFRLERDVLSKGPIDLLLIEAAVNDTSNTGEYPDRILRGMEGVVRHARSVGRMTDIVQMHFVMPEHMKNYNGGQIPPAIKQHERVAKHYGNTSLNLSREVTDRINAGQFTWNEDFRNLHPSPFGQKLYAASISRMFDAAFSKTATQPVEHLLPERSLDKLNYSNGRFGGIDSAKLIRGFELVPNWKPASGAGTRSGFVNVPVLVATSPGAAFEFQFDGTGAGLMIGAGPDTGVIEFNIDDGPPETLDSFTQWSRSLYLPWALILDDALPAGPHTVRVRLSKQKNPKATGSALYVYQLLLN